MSTRASEKPARTLKRMGDREFVAFVATMGMTISFAVDIILPAFDDVKASLGLAPDSNAIALTITVYFVAMSGAQLIYGPLADHFGRKPVLHAGLLIYFVGAIMSAFASSLAMLLLSRAVWGVGAASLRVLSNTIVRDLYQGDRMARVLSLVMSVFLLGPIAAPLIGEVILIFGPWQVVLAACGALAVVTALWSTRLPETLDPGDARPLRFSDTALAVRTVVRTRVSIGYALTAMFTFAVLATFLASSQLVIDEIYGRPDQYALLFALLSVGPVAFAYLNSRLVVRFGSHHILNVVGVVFVASNAILALLSIAAEGTPNFWVWFAFNSLNLSLVSMTIPTANAMAMAPLGKLAGTAAGVLGTIFMGGGSILAAGLDSTITNSVTPMSIGAFVFATSAYLTTRWAQRTVTATQTPGPA